MSSSWLSVGKSFKRTVAKSDEASGDPVALNTILDTDSILHADRKRNSEIGEGEHDRKKHKKDKKDKKVKKGSSKKSKKDRKDKKELTSREKPSTALVTSRSHKSAAPATDRVDFSSSDSDFSSSDDESRTHNSTRRIIHQNRAEIMSGNSELTFLPNGEVVLLPSFARADDTSVSWMVDSRGDKNNFIYAGTQPSEHVYTVYPGAIYYTNVSHLPPQAGYTNQSRSQRLMQPMTSAQQYRRSVERPSGIVVSAKQQHRNYDQASKTALIFMHRTELLSERRRETRLNHKYRYFSPVARNVLNDAALTRLNLQKATQSGSSNSIQNVSVMLPFSYIDSTVLYELGFASSTTASSANTLNSVNTTSTRDNPITSETEATNYTTAAARAQTQCNTLTRDTNLSLREKPHDLHTILHAVSVQSTICTLQLVAAGRSYDSITHARANNKTQLALQKSIAERKTAILEQSIEHNRSNERMTSVLYEQLVYILMQLKQADKVSHTLARATVDCPYNHAVRMVQHIYSMGVFNTSACTVLTTSLNNIYNEVSLAAQNALAAQQLNTTLLSAVYNNTTSVGTMPLQQEYQQLLLEERLVQLQCDMFLQKVLVERSAGNVEKAVAMAQSVLDFNLSRSAPSVEEYCTYWDSECIRMGELYHILPSNAYMTLHSSHTVGSSSTVDIHRIHSHSQDTGYDAWVIAGRPAEPPVHSLFSPAAPDATSQDETSGCIDGATLNCLRDDVHRIVAALGIVESGGQKNYAHNSARGKAVPSNGTTATVSDSDGINPHIDQNAAAAEYFLQQMLVSDTTLPTDDEYEGHDHLFSINDDQPTNTSATPVTTNPDTVNTTNNVADPEEDMVYSRLHGYKIKVHKESTGAIYKKILTDMGSVPASDTNTDTSSSQTNDTKSTATELTANKLKQLASAGNSTTLVQSSTRFATNTILSKQWKSNVYSKYTQYRPLRAAAFVDSASVEQQPERVIFSSDISSALFRAEYSTDSSIIDVQMRQKLKQSLVVRVLQAFGVVFLHNTCSHSLFSRSCELHIQDINHVLNVDEAMLYNSITNASSTITTPTNSLANPVSCYVLHLLSAGNAMLMPVCTVPVRIVKAHLLCAKLGLDSELNFIIRIIADILHTSTNDTNTSDGILSAGFVAQLRCVLLRLLTIRCHAELYKSNSVSASNTISDTDKSTEAIAQWRTQCRSLLETSICTTAATQDNTQYSTFTPLVGELSLWAEYLQCEVMLGQTTEALKLADKVVKSLQPPSLSANESVLGYSGIEKLTYTAILLALQANSASITNTNPSACLLDCSPANVHNALSVLTQYAHNLIGFNPIFGKYNNELKPIKATNTKTGKNTNVPTRLSQECIVGAIEAMQNAILVEVEKLQEQIVRQRKNEGVHLQVEDGSLIEFCSKLYHLVLLMAWLQYLSIVYASRSAIPTTFSTTMIEDAVQQGDAVFTAASSMLRSILIPSTMNDTSATTQTSSSRTEAGGEKRHFSHFFHNFLPGTGEVTCNSGAIECASIPELQYIHNVSMTSEVEVNVVLLFERLHCARLHFILQTSASAVITRSNNDDKNKPLQLSPSCKNTLHNAIQAAIRDFPLNKYIQMVHTVYAIAQPAGVTHMRAYYKDLAQHRQLWGGALQPTEILHMLCVEIFQANKTLLLDPLRPTIVACSDVLAVFDREEVYNSHQCNSTHSAATQALSLCKLWSDDSAQYVRTFLEATLSKHTLSTQMPVLWVFYIHLETSRGRFNEAKRLFFRAVSVCGWCQNLYTLCWGPLKQGFTESELTSLSTMMEQRGLHPLRAVEDGVGM